MTFLRPAASTCGLLAVLVAWGCFAARLRAEVKLVPAHVISGTVTDTLVAIDAPYSGDPNVADNGFTGPLGGDDGGSTRGAWEPDGTVDTNASWHIGWKNNGTVSFTFDLPDGAIIHNVYHKWHGQSNQSSNVVYSYNEGTPTTTSRDHDIASTGNLALQWTAAGGAKHNTNFERIFTGPITVAGGNGFTVTMDSRVTDGVDTSKVMSIDALVIDVTGYIAGTDTTPPTLAASDIVDHRGGGPVDVNTQVTYTLTFSEDMAGSTITAADFDNAGTAGIRIEAISETSQGIFNIKVRPITGGTLRLRIPAGSYLTDAADNPLNTSSAIIDDSTITVNVPNDFGTWIDGFGLAAANKDPGDDMDGDGLPNGIEAWFGTDPARANAGLTLLATVGTTASFSHPRNPAPPDDLGCAYQWSSDLVHWYADGVGPAGGPTVTFATVPAGPTTTVTGTASESLSRLFLRAAVTRDVSVADLQRDFLELKFGMFIHYNMATYTGEEWVTGYRDPAIFNPGVATIDTDAWADAAKSAGMTYGVLTVKHVAGFCLWDSAYTTYDVMNPACPYQKDIVDQFVRSFTSRGLKAGFHYHWRHPGFGDPNVHKVLPPECDPANHSLAEQIAFQRAQIAELIAKYPDCFYFWNDAYDPGLGTAADLLAHERGVRPDLLTCSNWWDWGLKGTPYLDIAVKELNHFPYENQAPGETCWHLEQTWFWKTTSSPGSAQSVIGNLNSANTRNSNFLLNVGLDPSGHIIPASVQRLAEVGALLQP